ncbi:ABC transporter permease [Arthrobacter sp. OAP107]|uniref:ABC transporter permease n=1 Tax=Arthrobacter sp. OAP107 TaxID=3156445 RepID=UPI003397EFD0
MTQTITPTTSGKSRPKDTSKAGNHTNDRLRRVLSVSGMLPVLVLLIIVGSILSPAFLTATNFSNVLRLGAVIGLLAVGQTLVVLSGRGGIDLSVAQVASASAVVGSLYQAWGLPAVLVAALLTGVFFGVVNGIGVSFSNLQPFIVTLATMTMAKGVAFELTNASPLPVTAPGLSWFSTGLVLGIPVPIVILAVVVIVGQLGLSGTTFGRSLYAVGGNEEAAYGAGINVRGYRIGVYVISSVLAALAGVLGMAQLNTADPNFASGYELSAIAAVVVGGTLLAGGRGNIFGTLIGVVIMALVSNLLNLLNVNQWTNLMVTGLIIVIVVSVNRPADGDTRRQRVLKSAPLFGLLLLGAVTLYGVLK